ncbi:MAG: DUF169 domain-containing protein [Bacteroidales bacterium]|nr:DUF169 domain-containing protein [Bacteroidales bacterium]
MQTSSIHYLLEKTNFNKPVIAVYDAPAGTLFQNIIQLKKEGHVCLFAHYKQWMNGKMLKMTAAHFGCGGCGTWMFGVQGRSRQSYIEFLTDDEGLKANHKLMGDWFDQANRYEPEHDAIFVGAYDERFARFIKSITFFVNPDQLSVFVLAANYFASPTDPDPVKIKFASGCSEILPHVSFVQYPQAVIGSTDMAMRKYLPPNILAFTVNPSMYANLCRLDEKSFLNKPFLEGLKKARGGEIGG